jgi:hypothetical protein
MTESEKRHIAWDVAILTIGCAILIGLVLVGAL